MQHLRGASAVRYAVAEHLKSQYKDRRLTVLNAWKMGGDELPPITSFSPFDVNVMSSGDEPKIGVDVVNSGTYVKTDHDDDASQEFRPIYAVRVTLWLYSQNDEAGNPLNSARLTTIRQRDDQLAILKSIILSRPSLGAGMTAVNTRGLSETYLSPTPTPNNSSRWVIAGQLSFDVQTDEWVTEQAVGSVDDIDLSTEVLVRDPSYFNNVDRLP